MTLSNLNYLLKVFSPNTVTLEVKSLTYEFDVGDTIQCLIAINLIIIIAEYLLCTRHCSKYFICII